MSFENPTALRIGLHGNFAGKDFQLLDRVVMGVEVNGETYYWNEFNLRTETGESATLVYEDDGNGGEWRLFTMFEPEYPLTAADAATKQVGDQLNLNGADVSVTLVSSSRVYGIEGLPAEGLQVGDEAAYFNAEAGGMMQVVSWTGKEVEYYNGVTLSAAAVETAFSVSRLVPAKMFGRSFGRSGGSSSGNGSDSESYTGTGKFLLQIGLVILLLFIVFGHGLSCFRISEAAPVKRITVAPPSLIVGATGQWGDKHFHVTAHAVVEVDEVGMIYERHEYKLTDDNGLVTLLVCGDRPVVGDWILFSPLTPLLPPAATESAAQKIGDAVNVDGVTGTVRELFEDTIRQAEDDSLAGWQANEVQYGYLARSPYATLLVRWNNSGISYYSGKIIPAKNLKDFKAAFAGSNGK